MHDTVLAETFQNILPGARYGLGIMWIQNRCGGNWAHSRQITLADGTRLTGTVGGVRGDVLLSVSYSKLAARHRLRSWIQLVALAAALPRHEWRAVTIGRGRGGVDRYADLA